MNKQKMIYTHAKNNSELSRSLDNPRDQLFPASWEIFYLSFQSQYAFFMVQISDETNRDTLPGALNGSITYGAFA